MEVVHFLNVKEGDCSIIEHLSGHISMIDICNGNDKNLNEENGIVEYANHNQKKHPLNPVDYLKNITDNGIFRFILTHPDMDHMNGIESLFTQFSVDNFWDTDNNKKMDEESFGGRYRKEDWEYYQKIRESMKNPKTLKLLAGEKGKYYNEDENGNTGGDGLYILAPSKKLVATANDNGGYNDISYTILYKTSKGRKIIFAGDSEKKTWDYILESHKDEVTNIDVLIAPHHGRKSGGNDEYLDILNPKLTLFGNADSKDLDYNSWNNRGLKHYTNNQGNCFILEIDEYEISVYCTYEKFAKKKNPQSEKNTKYNAWYIEKI